MLFSYMLREDGTALDDAYVYRLGRDKYMVVFNAGNYEQDIAWITAVNEVGLPSCCGLYSG
jgi:glycine cleavage system aminomethyltransferase T